MELDGPLETRLERITEIWDTLPDSVQDVLVGLAELGHKQPELTGMMAGSMGPRKVIDYPRAITNMSNAVVGATDLKGNIRYANKTAKDVLEMLCGKRDNVNLAEVLENYEDALDLLKSVVDSDEITRFVERTALASMDQSKQELFFIEMFPIQEFGDKEKRKNLVGAIAIPMKDIISMTEEYLTSMGESGIDMSLDN